MSIWYIDPQNGSSKAEGNHPNCPKSSLNDLPLRALTAGDTIRLRRGSCLTGSFSLTGQGSQAAPIVVESYGEGTNPVLAGDGDAFYALELRNCCHILVRDLEFMAAPGAVGMRCGLHITSGGKNHPGGVLPDITVQNCVIHDIGANLSRGAAGLLIENGESLTPCHYDGFLIDHCSIYNTGSCGIIFSSVYGRRPEIDFWEYQPLPFTPAEHVIIRGCRVFDLPGDGMWISTTKGALLEYNEVFNTSYGENTEYAGMWPHNSDDCVMQYNTVHHNRLGKGDGQGLDVDINCNRCVVQYNYSYCNEGGFLLVCTDGVPGNYNRGTVVRRNLSVDDGYSLITIKGIEVTGLQVSENLFYTQHGYENGTIPTLLWADNDATFCNNLFVNTAKSAENGFGRFVDNKNGEGKSRGDNALVHMCFTDNTFYQANGIDPEQDKALKVDHSAWLAAPPQIPVVTVDQIETCISGILSKRHKC